MFLMYVKELIALFPNQISERHTLYNKHYLVKESKMKSRPHQKFFRIDPSVQSKLHQKEYIFWDKYTVMLNNSLKKLTSI